MALNIAALLLCLSWVTKISGEAYSNVYVQRGSDFLPIYSYGSPKVDLSGQIARLSAPPIGSILPFQKGSTFVPPCVSPCVIAPADNAKIVTYNVPSVPVVATTKDEPSSYQYSYTVYDENTGDQKSQRELSDGVVVRGQYSFIQPDGYIREVQYTADDVTGFNAIVKNFLPDDTVKAVVKQDAPPCVESKSGSLKEEPKPEGESKGANKRKLGESNTAAAENLEDIKFSTYESKKPEQGKESDKEEEKKEGKPTEVANAADTDFLGKFQLYTNIINCVHAAIQKNNTGSALSYILIPNKPC